MNQLIPNTPLASAKRTKTERAGMHSWHPYYAGYSEQFVDSAIKHLNLSSSDIILDPWAGSGTTGIVATRSNIPSIMIDINEVMVSFAAAKTPFVLTHSENIRNYFYKLASINPTSQTPENDSLEKVFSRECAKLIRGVHDTIPRKPSFKNNPCYLESPSDKALLNTQDRIDPIYSFYKSVLLKTIRTLSGIKKSANPTWLKGSNEQISFTKEKFFESLILNCEGMLNDISRFYGSNKINMEHSCINGSVKKMKIDSDSIDAVITSPPYLTRIDYVMATLPEMLLSADESKITQVRHATTGAPVITKNERYQLDSWGATCNSILDGIKNHPTKAAATYYWKNIIQYFMDTHESLIEINRVLKKGGKALLVVQSSYFKEINIPLGELYCEMAEGLGMGAKISFREVVKGHMAHINTKSSKYKEKKVYYEDVVEITKLY